MKVRVRGERWLTLPLLDSIQAAFFLLSVTSAPAIVVVMVFGGMCRRPGPSVSVFFLPVGVGQAAWGSSSPGRTTVADAAIADRRGGGVVV